LSDNENYILGYGDGAMQWMATRTAEGHGAFLLPYLKPGMRMLDCGCGPGTLTLGFAQRVAPGETIGIDREASQFAATIETAQHEGIDNLRFETGDIYELPFADANFDVVFTSAVLGSVATPEKVVAEMARVLKPGGVLALKEFDHDGDIIWPQSPVIAHSIALYHRLRAHNGHAALAGRRLREFIHSAGCRTDYFHAFYEEHTDAASLRRQVERNNYLVAEILGQQYEALGWSTREALNEEAQAWLEFAANPAAIYCSSWCEAVGIKT